MKNKFRILKILITIVLFGFLLSFSMARFSRASVEKISVKMNSATPVYFVDEKDVKDLVRKENPSLTIGKLNIPLLEKTLNKLPAVDSANVYLNLNGNLNLNITQRVPIFRIINGDNDFYVDVKGIEFPLSRNYSHPCMLVTGDVKKSEYKKLADLISKINADDFTKKFFIGISKDNNSFSLLTSEGNYSVELGDLDNIDFKVKGFKEFVTKFLVDADPQKYSQISLKYDNQIVTTLNPGFAGNDSILTANYKELQKTAIITPRRTEMTSTKVVKTTVVKPKIREKVKSPIKPKIVVVPKKVVPKTVTKKKETVKKTEATKKKKTKIKVE